jgi:hypothetical protein
MKINKDYIEEYENIVKTTQLQRGYQEFLKFFNYLRIFLKKKFVNYKFTSSIVENKMDYSYFQMTSREYKLKGLKFVIAFIHKDSKYQIWLSGYNRSVQNKYFEKLKFKDLKYNLTNNPNKTDYILKHDLVVDYNNLEKLLIVIEEQVTNFINETNKFI